MKEQKLLHIVIPLLLLSLIGLVALQVQLLRDVYEQKESAFDRSVLNALHAVARTLETREVQSRVRGFMKNYPAAERPPVRDQSGSVGPTAKNGNGGSFRFEFHSPPDMVDSLIVIDDTITFTRTPLPTSRLLKTTVNDTIIEFDASGQPVRRRRITTESGGLPGEKELFFSQHFEEFDGAPATEGSPRLRRQELLAQAMDVVFISSGTSIEHTVTKPVLDSLIQSQLAESGIDLPYAFAIAGDREDSLRLVSSHTRYDDLRASRLSAGLFSGDLAGPRYRLLVFFPDRTMFIFRQMAPSLAATALFVLIILGSFAYAVRTIYRQKRFHKLLSDFINNMTHEFKTPISTVSVVTDTLTLPDVLKEREKILHYNGIIRDEIGRMRNHVDKILQMAVLEEGDYELKLSDVDVHAVIEGATEKFALRVGQRGGVITADLRAASHVVRCDANHFSNIIFNLLDNAEKYSPESPRISVSTESGKGTIAIAVRDHGIGIPEKEQKHVFDRYYRVSTGNIHDVKGFGLGLSYVRLITEAHHGTIQCTSTPGEGSTFTLRFPVVG